jgi:hypothetical protein
MEPDSGPAAGTAVTRSEIAAASALRDRIRAAVASASSAPPSSWSDREQQALDGLRAVAAFLHHHANTDVARAITHELRAS